MHIFSEKDKYVCIYGAGEVAKLILGFCNQRGLQVNKVYVGSKKQNPDSVEGVEVYEIDDIVKEQTLDKKRILIVCTSERYQVDIAKVIEKKKNFFEEIYYISDRLKENIEVKNFDDYVDAIFELKHQMESVNIKTVNEHMRKRLQRLVEKPCLEYLIVNILDHCNLKCQGCDHFACIADEYYVSTRTIEKDLSRLSEIMRGDYISYIGIMGGEPLLHPDLLEILRITRESFPFANIDLTTNGILLNSRDDSFWKCCKENNVSIVNTKYPINLDFDAMKDNAKKWGVEFSYYEGTGEGITKKSFKKQIDLLGKNDVVDSFVQCHISNWGNFLMEGKLYPCPFSCQAVRIFNQKFNKNLHLSDDDYLDIYAVKDKSEIFEFAARPHYFCRYCSGIDKSMRWKRTRGNIDEWV